MPMLTSQQFHTTKTDLGNRLQPGLLPTNIQVPAVLNVSGDFKGYLKEFDGKAIVQSSFGNATAEVSMSKKEEL